YLDNVPDTLIAQNVAYVCKDDQILKYHKVGNSAEVLEETRNLVFAPGSLAGRFNVGEVQYGLEICMDHWPGVLTASAPEPVHVHIITSSETQNRDFHYNVAPGGVVLHASTGTENIVPYVLAGTSKESAKLVADVPGKDSLRCYTFDLNDKVCKVGKC